MAASGTTAKGDQVRENLVGAAVRLLGEEGLEALQARRLTREIGASTMAVYHYFGGMPLLLQAVADEGFRRLDAALGAVRLTEDPVLDITRLGFAYRAVARENPRLYDLMFGLAAPGGHRPEHTPTVGDAPSTPAAAAYGHLVRAAGRAIDTGRMGPADPASAAAELWSVLHGFVGLELAGHLDHLTDPVGQVMMPMGAHLLRGLGADPPAPGLDLRRRGDRP